MAECLSSLCGLSLLANRHLQPTAALLRPAAVAVEALLAIPEMPLLLARFPLLLATDDVNGAATWQAAGGRPYVPARSRQAQTPAELPTVEEGYDWIEGPWFLAPPARPGAVGGASRATALQLLQLVNNDADTHQIEELFRRDAALSYQLLRLVNSLAMGGNRHIDSFAQAILILGRQQLRRWLNLLLFAANGSDRRVPMLLASAVLRARFCELLVHASGCDRGQQEHAFMAGMFSLLGALFGKPLPELLAPLQLAPVLRSVLLDENVAGSEAATLAAALRLAQAFERNDPAAAVAQCAALGLTAATVNSVQLQAWLWMLEVLRDMPGDEG